MDTSCSFYNFILFTTCGTLSYPACNFKEGWFDIQVNLALIRTSFENQDASILRQKCTRKHELHAEHDIHVIHTLEGDAGATRPARESWTEILPLPFPT